MAALTLKVKPWTGAHRSEPGEPCACLLGEVEIEGVLVEGRVTIVMDGRDFLEVSVDDPPQELRDLFRDAGSHSLGTGLRRDGSYVLKLPITAVAVESA